MSAIPTLDGRKVYDTYRPGVTGRWDAIVVGSGMGGMACAAALARHGRRVLVLEQHYVPGGFTHSFARKGWRWDAGVHALGEMRPTDPPGRMLRWLTGGRLELEPLGNPYDTFRFHDGFRIDLPDRRAGYLAVLKDAFPEQATQIERYVETVRQVAREAMPFFALKSLPEAVDVAGSRLLALAGKRDWWGVTTARVLDEHGITGKLRTVLTLHWGYYGSLPHESSFAIHALTHVHFWNGAYYPRGGSQQIAAHLLGAVREAGGETLVRADVAGLVVERGRAVGVRLRDGAELRAPVVVSAAGARTTVERLVPDRLRHSAWGRSIVALRDSPGYLCLNLGFEGDIAAAGASRANLWLFETWEERLRFWDLADPDSRAPILYVSFPSLKDPDHDPGPEQRHTGECITFVDAELFARWAGTEQGRRPADYQAFKRDVEDRMVAHLEARIPDVMKHAVYRELSTPLSTEHFARASGGAIYGLEATPERFGCKRLRTRTPLPGLYMTGVDVASLGVVGAMTSGLLTAATLEPRVYRQLV
ncbi:MAG: NAD(P)/FAD-dependent oxidoreductase [Polyangiaceae bacterium]|nr:NAD(P)/FAD-dependent oxidoreductase [Polyangiaceae bacterium]